MRKLIRYSVALLTVLSVALWVTVAYSSYKIPNEIYVTDLNNIRTNLNLPISHTVVTEGDVRQVYTDPNSTENYDVKFNLFGVIPIESTRVTVSDVKRVRVLGLPFGVKLYTDGVLIVNITEFDTVGGTACPAKSCGLKSGDYILTVQGEKVYSNKDVEKLLQDNIGSSLRIVYLRNGKKHSTNIIPEISTKDNMYHLGMWLKDSSAGIGTLTFYDEENGVLAGLGHALCDNDTGKMISVNRGSIVEAEILSVTKSRDGYAGELNGRFVNREYSKILTNSQKGIYAVAYEDFSDSKIYEVCNKQEIKEGTAEIITTVEGESPKAYECKIKAVNYSSGDTRNMVVEITDKDLLAKTGGIVQGMSGSPIIQDNKLVGAVTHVFVNDPTRGYGIFAENMLETAQSVAENNKLKDAS